MFSFCLLEVEIIRAYLSWHKTGQV